MCTAVEYCRAGGQGQVLASTMPISKQGSKRFNFITKTILFAHLGILFIYAYTLTLMYSSRLLYFSTHQIGQEVSHICNCLQSEIGQLKDEEINVDPFFP